MLQSFLTTEIDLYNCIGLGAVNLSNKRNSSYNDFVSLETMILQYIGTGMRL
jgi:hypothetical protein